MLFVDEIQVIRFLTTFVDQYPTLKQMIINIHLVRLSTSYIVVDQNIQGRRNQSCLSGHGLTTLRISLGLGLIVI